MPTFRSGESRQRTFQDLVKHEAKPEHKPTNLRKHLEEMHGVKYRPDTDENYMTGAHKDMHNIPSRLHH